MTTSMSFERGGDFLQFEAGADYPANRKVNFFQVKDRTASGSLRVESLGVLSKTRTLNFTMMSKTDYDAMLDFFINVTNGSELEFIFTDEYSFSGSVRFVDDVIDFDETSFELYSGSINLEYI